MERKKERKKIKKRNKRKKERSKEGNKETKIQPYAQGDRAECSNALQCEIPKPPATKLVCHGSYDLP